MEQQPTSAPDLLSRAAAIMDERGKQYDQDGGERSMAKCVKAFNAMTGRDLTEEDGWAFMATLKLVRFFQNTAVPHRDSLEDLISYAALLGESALSKATPLATRVAEPLPIIFHRRKEDRQQCLPNK